MVFIASTDQMIHRSELYNYSGFYATFAISFRGLQYVYSKTNTESKIRLFDIVREERFLSLFDHDDEPDR